METLSTEIRSRLDAAGLDWLTPQQVLSVTSAVALLLGGWLMARLASRAFARLAADRLTPQGVMLGRMATYYAILGLAVVTALDQLGLDLSVLVGAAGLLTVALGFAAQTSASNLISGMFLLGERPFVLGDLIQAGQTTGEVVGIDLMSVKLRTFDNLLVRIPNESLLKSQITNLTHFPLRRVDLELCVPHEVELPHIRKILIDAVAALPSCMDEPKPNVMFVAFADHGVQLKLVAWGTTEGYVGLKSAIADQISATLRQHGIPFAPPRRLVQLLGDQPPGVPRP